MLFVKYLKNYTRSKRQKKNHKWMLISNFISTTYIQVELVGEVSANLND